MVDMSAAFDVVDTELLLEKLKLYGFDRNAIQWTWSYLTHRSQGVYIDGSMSSLLALEAGVPQGSILGPIYYTTTLSSLMNYHRWSMRLIAQFKMNPMPASSLSSARSVVGSAAMQMTVLIL